jgi:hypothetical protein
MEKHKLKPSGFVLSVHLVGRAAVSARGCLVLQYAYFQRRNAARHRRGNLRLGAPINDAIGQMPSQIKYAGPGDARRQIKALLEQ